MVHAPIIPLFSLTGILWISSFISDGFVKDDAEAKKIYQQASVVAMVTSLCCLPIIAPISDKANPLWTMPLAFLIRFFFAGSFRFVKNPNSLLTVLLFTGLAVSSSAQAIIIMGWYNRKMNKEIRGNMTNLISIVSTAGLVLFVAITGKAYDVYGPSAPFSILAGLDLFTCLLATALAYFGILK